MKVTQFFLTAFSRSTFFATALVLLVSCQSVPLTETLTQFALIGDNPYADFDIPKYQRLISQVNEREDILWTVHVGDLKASTVNCSDETFQQLYDLNAQFVNPFIVTPGDNDWFDCARISAGAWDRRERLQRFREVFYSTDSLTSGVKLTSQAESPDYAEYLENVYWEDQDVVFGTLHLVYVSGKEGGVDFREEMVAASVAWLDEIFAIAKTNNAAGVFLATQVNPWFFSVERGLLAGHCGTCEFVTDGYQAINDALVKHAREFARPIVLATGDTHIFRVDKPLYDGEHLIENFTRVEVFGAPSVHWIRVVVNPGASQLFEFHQEIIPENTGYGWHPQDRQP